MDDPEYTSLIYINDPSEDLEVLKKSLPHVFKEDGTPKTYIPAFEYLKMRHPKHYKYPLYENPSYNLLIAGSRDSGKALRNSSILYTEVGTTTIGKIVKGDRIYGDDGKLTTVVNVYPQGEVDIYRVKLGDGREIDCSLDHL